MIVIPTIRRRNKNYWKILALALLTVVILVCSFLSVYWFVFGTRNPFVKNSFTRPSNIYVAPSYRLDGVLKTKILQSASQN